MKLVRYGPRGAEKPGLIDADGAIRDLSAHVPDIDAQNITPDSLSRLAALDPNSLAAVPSDTRLGAPIGNVRSFLAVGLNFVDHAKEGNFAMPGEPVLFNKLASCINGPYDDVIQPKGASKLDWEVELAFVVGRSASYVNEADALDYIAGFCICNDISERAFQLEHGGQWMKGKSAETLGPLGPWLVTRDEIPDVQALGLWLDVNGTRMQTGSTANMIFPIAHILHYMSQFMVLEPGDVVTTGTPAGVGLGRTPQVFLKPGDVMTLGIDGLGQQNAKVVAWEETV